MTSIRVIISRQVPLTVWYREFLTSDEGRHRVHEVNDRVRIPDQLTRGSKVEPANHFFNASSTVSKNCDLTKTKANEKMHKQQRDKTFNFTFKETLFLSLLNLLSRKRHTIQLQTKQSTPEVLSAAPLATKSYRLPGIQLYSTYSLCYDHFRIHPNGHDLTSLVVCHTNVVPSLVFDKTSTRTNRDGSPARALHYDYLKYSSTDHAQLKSSTIGVVVQYDAGSSFVVHPYQNSDRISSVQFSSVGDLHVAISSAVKLRGAVASTIRTLTISNSNKCC